jgi:hypothetical protein
MPLVVMSFRENLSTRSILSHKGPAIAQIVASALGYELSDIAVKPAIVNGSENELSYNLPELEFNIVGGSRFVGKEQEKAAEIWGKLATEIPGLSKVRFAIWLQSTTGAYVDSEH